MSPIVILLTIAAYFAVLFLVSWLAGRNADNAGFFSGNRQSHWVLVMFSTIGAAISGVTFVSVPGMVQGAGFSYMQMVLGFTVGQIIVAYVLIPMYYRMNLTSIYQYLESRFGITTYRTGAWFFFVSKMLGASVRLFVVGSVLQLLVFGPLGVPFWVNALFTVAIVYLCTFKGGVRSVIWTDLLKTLCLVLSVVLCIVCVLRSGVSFDGFGASEMSKTFFFDDANDGKFFWKQFLAGIFLVIATTGLDQDLMQRTLSCKNYKDAQKNMISGAVMQIFVIFLFLVLGWLLYTYAAQTGISLEGMKGDDVFPYLATGKNPATGSMFFPMIVGILFIVGFIASAYSAAGSALTALTTSFTIDILGQQKTVRTRQLVHAGMAVLMAVCIYVIWLLNDDSVIQTVYKVASYTYGPLLGMFCFGMFTRLRVRDRWIPLVAVLAPVLTWIIDANSAAWFAGYQFSHERLLLNALLAFLGMLCLARPAAKDGQ
ncbi:MAG: sodium:solute symporter [Paludibacteraceae bacterium]|nr:sodium:solute symporter [Paludibacteraceae bacterium]MBQ9704688.1 sodium:solute symporter [Paludibacteraceae bacterium]